MDRIARELRVTRSLIMREALKRELDRLERGEPVLGERVA